MSATEFAFLALGLLLGTATGAALVVVLRARPPAPREVRVTVAPPALARPATTLAHALPPDQPSAMDADPSWPAPDDLPSAPPRTVAAVGAGAAAGAGSIAGAGSLPPGMDAPRALALGLVPSRAHRAAISDGTTVRSRPVVLPERTVALRIEPAPSPATFPPVVRVAGSRAAPPDAPAAPTPVSPAAGGQPSNAPTARPLPAVAARGRRDEVAPVGGGPAPAPQSPEDRAMPTPSPGTPSAPADPCAEPRRLAIERRELAERAAAEARAAAESLRSAHRSYDEHVARADQAERDADPRAIRTAKDLAQRAFHEARARASTPEALEAAARTWLQEINTINRRHREARATLERARAAAHELLPTIERLGLEADAARIAAESAAAASLEASEALAACEEAAQPEATPAPAGRASGSEAGDGVPQARPKPSLDGLPTIVAILRGDDRALDRVVAAMAGGDRDEERRWRLRMAALVDAIMARAIESAYLEFPAGHRFWGPFTQQQCRDVTAALASLGFRYDGLGGFADERVPGQRDLSLAVGYAGLDPMRIRIWPSEAEMPLLFREAVVAADQWLAEAGGDLLLGEMVDALGRRADELADVWNAWGRLRPLLLADA